VTPAHAEEDAGHRQQTEAWEDKSPSAIGEIGVKQTFLQLTSMSVIDPFQTSLGESILLQM
jgi:hypothetical protein